MDRTAVAGLRVRPTVKPRRASFSRPRREKERAVRFRLGSWPLKASCLIDDLEAFSPIIIASASMPPRTSEHQLARARGLRREQTKAEEILWRSLRDRQSGPRSAGRCRSTPSSSISPASRPSWSWRSTGRRTRRRPAQRRCVARPLPERHGLARGARDQRAGDRWRRPGAGPDPRGAGPRDTTTRVLLRLDEKERAARRVRSTG